MKRKHLVLATAVFMAMIMLSGCSILDFLSLVKNPQPQSSSSVSESETTPDQSVSLGYNEEEELEAMREFIVGEWDADNVRYFVFNQDGTMQNFKDLTKSEDNVIEGTFTITGLLVSMTDGSPNGFEMTVDYTSVTIRGVKEKAKYTWHYAVYIKTENSARLENLTEEDAGADLTRVV